MNKDIKEGIIFDLNKKIRKKTVDSVNSIKAAKKDLNKRIEEYDNVVPIKEDLNIEIANKTFYNDIDEWSINRDIIQNHKFVMTGYNLGITLFKLSTSALKIIGYVFVNIEYNSNRIDIDTNDFCEKANINPRYFYSAVAELDKHNIMYRTVKQGIYSVNPLYIFKGSLIRFIKLYEKKYSDKEIKLDKKGRIIIDD